MTGVWLLWIWALSTSTDKHPFLPTLGSLEGVKIISPSGVWKRWVRLWKLLPLNIMQIPQIPKVLRGTVSAYKQDTEDKHTAFVKGWKLLVASPTCSFGDPLHQDSFSPLLLLKAQDSPCSATTIPSSRNTIYGRNLTPFVYWWLTRLISTQVTLTTGLLERYEEFEFLNISSWDWEMYLNLFICLGLFFCLFPAVEACEIPVPGGQQWHQGHKATGQRSTASSCVSSRAYSPHKGTTPLTADQAPWPVCYDADVQSYLCSLLARSSPCARMVCSVICYETCNTGMCRPFLIQNSSINFI